MTDTPLTARLGAIIMRRAPRECMLRAGLSCAVLSTSALALIHGIMARRRSPDLLDRVSVVHAARRLEFRLARLALADPLGGEGAGLNVLQDLASSRPSCRSLMMRGPDTYSPNSAVLEIE